MKNNEVKVALIALMGVIVGSVVSGWLSFTSIEKQIELAETANRIEYEKVLKSQVVEYKVLVDDLLWVIDTEEITVETLMGKMRAIVYLGHEIMLHAPDSIYTLTGQVNNDVIDACKFIIEQEKNNVAIDVTARSLQSRLDTINREQTNLFHQARTIFAHEYSSRQAASN